MIIRFFGRIISGHAHLLSILSWGILVYQMSMSFFALHFTTRENKKVKKHEKLLDNDG
ncbi:hypothetical protein SUT286_20140 [Streptococcus parasuis]|nr:hypothetical protein SUT286_20140 [Streptococcus parasuis]